MINNNERTNIMKQCVECGCTPKNDEWAVNSDKHCMDCEQEYKVAVVNFTTTCPKCGESNSLCYQEVNND